jgi:site-specific DNA-methyltransferase (adenine-specific)
MSTKSEVVNTIEIGDCIEALRLLAPDSVDCVIADPPYNIGKDFGNNFDRMDVEAYVSWCEDWINECFRVLKPSGTMFIYGFSEILAHLSVRITQEKRWLIWHYTNKNVASLQFWQRSHEAIICTWKGKPLFNRDAVREPYTESFLANAVGKPRKDTAGRFSRPGNPTVYQAHESGALPRDVLKVPALAGGAGRSERWALCHTCDVVIKPGEGKNHEAHDLEKHPTQKPFALTRRLLLSCMPAGGTLAIPFSGTGSESAVAKALGFNSLAWDLNPNYVRLGLALLDSTEAGSILVDDDL